MDPALLLSDDDCGFCPWSVAKLLAWDRRGALRAVAIQSKEGARLLADLDQKRRSMSWHVVAEGRRWSTGAALVPVFERFGRWLGQNACSVSVTAAGEAAHSPLSALTAATRTTRSW